jgi:16S rRNA (uracil1498-N3)-methyltransferase
LKGDRSEWAVAKAVELGATRIVPLLSARVVVKWRGDVATKSLARWRRVAEESMGQCRRTWGVRIDEALRTVDVPSEVAVCDIGATGTLGDASALAIGPEGGWSSDDWGEQRRRVGLGDGVLRAETAAVVAATIIASRASDWPVARVEAPSDKDDHA